MLLKGVVIELPMQEVRFQGFYSSLLLVPTKDGGMRPVANLKGLNESIVPHHTKMEGLHTLRELLKSGDWLAKVNLKILCFMVLVHNANKPFLHFMA